MRIAVYHNLPSGGGKRALFEITSRLAGGHVIDVFTTSAADQDFCDLKQISGEHLAYRFTPTPLVKRPFGRMNQLLRVVNLSRLQLLQKQIAAEIDRRSYDVVFVHHCRFGQSPFVLRYLRTPTLYYCHEPPRHVYEISPPRPSSRLSSVQRVVNLIDLLPQMHRHLMRRQDRLNAGEATRVLTNSHYSRESIYRTYGVFAKVAYLGVDCQLFRPTASEKRSFALSVGALTSRKGFDFLIMSLALIPDSSRPVLVVACNYADSDEYDYLVQLARDNEVTLEIKQQVSDKQLVQLYSEAALTLYSPVMEPFGFVPLESMACATPVIGVREAGVRESVSHGESGLLIEREPDLFAQAIAGLLQDAPALSQLGRQARAYVERQWQWSDSVQYIESQLAEVASL